MIATFECPRLEMHAAAVLVFIVTGTDS